MSAGAKSKIIEEETFGNSDDGRGIYYGNSDQGVKSPIRHWALLEMHKNKL